MTCLNCGRGFHDECDIDPCCCDSSMETIQGEQKAVTISAGRKRAAKQYEIDLSTPCEWRGLANCGGGFEPVVGCIVGFQLDRHHGPDKNTTNNSPDNVHLICKPCHNLWHRRNDPLYGEDKCPDGIQLHEPRWASEQELLTKEVSI